MAGVWTFLDVVQVRAKDVEAGPYAEAVAEVLQRVRDDAGDEPRMCRGAKGLRPTDRSERGRLAGRRPLVLANDRPDVALAAGADGVHVGAEDLPPGAVRAMDVPDSFVVGITCHTRAELEQAPNRGADYVGLGSFFPSTTKKVSLPDPRPALRELTPDFEIPIYAIGGMTLGRLAHIPEDSRISGVVVSSAIQASADPARETRRWRARLDA